MSQRSTVDILALARQQDAMTPDERETRVRLTERGSPVPALSDCDLLVAHALPVSKALHLLAFVVRNDGRFEFAERIVPIPMHNTVFHKETGRISDDRLCLLRTRLMEMCNTNLLVNKELTLEHEGPDRRTMSFWHHGKQETSFNWSDALFEKYSVPSAQVQAFRLTFDTIWNLLLSLVEIPSFESQSLTGVGTWTFPLKSKYATLLQVQQIATTG